MANFEKGAKNEAKPEIEKQSIKICKFFCQENMVFILQTPPATMEACRRGVCKKIDQCFESIVLVLFILLRCKCYIS